MSEHVDKILEQVAALRAPLAGDSPAGADIALEPEFERIKAELDKLTSLDGGTPEWGLVVRESEDLLTNRTKDIRLAVWLAVGGAEQRGWNGFARGLAVCRSLMVDLWDSALPKRDKARNNIVGWLAERGTGIVQNLKVTRDDESDVRAVAELVQDIDRTMADKLGDAFQGIRALVSASKARVNDIPPPPPPKAPTPPPPPPTAATEEWADDDAPAPSVAAAPAGGVVLSVSAADADATTKTAAEALALLARSLMMADPSRAWAYALHRKAIWLRVEAVPATLEDPPSLRERLASLVAESRWQELVFAGEEASARHPLWLDPQRFVALALERLGSAFNEAREVVGREASDFARRHARLLDARFTDGTPAVSVETAAWLEAESKRWLRATEADVARDEDREIAARFADARHLVASGHHAEGLAIAMQLARRGSDPRERFRSSLDVARLACEVGAHDVARPILESLVTVAEAHALETWEPALAARLHATLYRALPDSPERAKAFESLCRIDPGRALRVVGRGRTESATVPTNGTNGTGIGNAIAAIASVFSAPAPSPSAAPAQAPAKPAEPPPPLKLANPDSEWADDD